MCKRAMSARAWIVAALGLLASCEAQPLAGQACEAGLVAGDLVITEVFADPAGADEGREWIELYNATSETISLAGVQVRSSKADGAKARGHVIGGGEVPAGGYAVLGSSLPELAPPYVHYGYGSALGELFNGEGGALSLACGGVELDAVRYQRVRAGRSRAFDGGVAPDAIANDAAETWCDSATPFGDAGDSFGTPGARNDDCEVVVPGRCLDAASGSLRDVVRPAPGDLAISEVMADPAAVADALGEWIEVEVRRDVDLNGLGVDRLGDSAAPSLLSAQACLRVAAGSFAVLARSQDPARNGGLPRVDAILPLSLVSGSAASPGDVQLLSEGALLDGVRWTRAASGRATQVDPRYLDPTGNDEERVWCEASAPYGAGDRGSPGAANSRCTIPPPEGMCEQDGGVRPARKPAVGQLVITEFMANPAGTDSNEEWFEVTNAGSEAFDLNGLSVDRAGDSSPPSPLASPTCKSVSPGGFAVLARSADPARNAGLPSVALTYSLSMGDAGDLQILDGGTVLDAITWSDAPNAASAQLDRAYTSASANDEASHFCASAVPYGTGANRGSPGAPNARCP